MATCAHICAQMSIPGRSHGSEEDIWTDEKAVYDVNNDAAIA